ncbi:hypothetical protein C5748_25765 [Phyllobacterium phragmitis]|uniref:Uncharacterized protein n=1 Tax=Phyllobacterium phragmitis TaxID=2670329 RepID=A0A2S9IJI9_9HYPH|nr:hypothetical protein [Phyllobacterium phragmitis]PRD40675.1 hypothetical protein C5748_25765 [Phyllobacterium phragmitis]
MKEGEGMSTDGKFIAIPRQAGITLEFFDGGISINQTCLDGGGESSVHIFGQPNLEALIAALQKAREAQV